MIYALRIITPEYSPWVDDQRPMLGGVTDVCIHVGCEATHEYATEGFNSLCWTRIHHLRALLDVAKDGDWVVLLDADILLFAPLVKIVARAEEILSGLQGVDICAQHDPDAPLCAGFMVMRVSPGLRAFVDQWLAAATTTNDDQHSLNIIHPPAALFSAQEIGSYGNLHGGLWQSEPFTVPSGLLAFHCNYMIGLHKKCQVRDIVLSQIHQDHE